LSKDQRRKVPDIHLLKLDKDVAVDQVWLRDYIHLVLAVCASFHLEVNSIKMCESEHGGQHFYIAIRPPVCANLANRIQFLLGDDCRRVDFNRARIRSGLAEWSKLFEVPHAKLRTIFHPSWFLPGHEKL
jgi:hypothetical protein